MSLCGWPKSWTSRYCSPNALTQQDSVRFVVNASYSSLLGHLQSSLIGLHTMANEHFGIGVVELMAAGLIPIAHDSAGPKMDILSATHNDQSKHPKSGLTLACHGFLAKEAHEYAEYFARVLAQWKNDPAELQRLQKINQQVAHANFSAEHFSESFLSKFEPHIAPSQ